MRIVLGVGGGIAAYKAAALASALVQAGHEVQAALTPPATRFVGPLTFEALTHRPVAVDFADRPMGPLSHVAVAEWADAMVVAPATADLLARMAEGRGDDFVTLVYLGLGDRPVLVAPAMESAMWEHPATRRNRRRLEADGVMWVGPEEGRLASGAYGPGRMAEPAAILDHLEWMAAPKPLEGRRVMVTAGPTWEFFDPVRLLTNPSTGWMGWQLARVARNLGARVTLVRGPTPGLPPLAGVDTVAVVSALDMREAVLRRFRRADVVVFSAAVSDFRPKAAAARKLHKDEVPAVWEMERNPDILRELGQLREGQGGSERPILVGFAADSGLDLDDAWRKLQEKGLDLIVANRVGPEGGFGNRQTTVVLIRRDGTRTVLTDVSKAEAARQIWQAVTELPGWRPRPARPEQ